MLALQTLYAWMLAAVDDGDQSVSLITILVVLAIIALIIYIVLRFRRGG